MKKWLIILLISAVTMVLTFSTSALAQNSSCYNVRVKAVTVNGKTRTVFIWVDEDGLHFKYFSDDTHGLIVLGEEVFKDGEKTKDNYRENDGLRPMN